jgi:uncharacterized protein (TIGR03435 family)
MMRAFAGLSLAAVLFGQSAEQNPAFEVADVHVSRPSKTARVRGPYIGGTRYELRSASMLDLVRTAYGFDDDKIVGGPTWLETDRFDVNARTPPGSTREATKTMLQTLLAERFSLVVHKDMKPLSTFALTAGKKPLLKEADGSGETGCKLQTGSAGASGEGGGRLMMSGADGKVTTINFGPGAMLQYSCRNMTMAAFAEQLGGMLIMGSDLGRNPVIEDTGLKGKWNFDVKWSLNLGGPMMTNAGDRITVFNAVDKQLGLKLEPRQVPMPVIVVDSVNRTPTPNLPGVTQSLPPLPTEFEVADIKPSSPDFRGNRFQIQPGGRVNIQGMSLKSLILNAWDLNSDEMVVGGPKFLDTERFDIVAKAPTFGPPPDSSSGPSGGPAAFQQVVDSDAVNLMLRALLIERFKLVVHNEERPVNAFTLTALKPKLRKADPSNRMGFHEGPGADGKDPRLTNPAASRLVSCQNMTMAQLAENLPRIAGGYIRGADVLDATGIEGAFDFTLNFSAAGMVNNGGGRGRGGEAGGVNEASDPGGAISLNDALEKQLGLKLETTKRPVSVLVIDHVEQKPTEN